MSPDALPADRVVPPVDTTVARDLGRLGPYRSAIRETCSEWGEDPFLLAAICLRESGAGYAPGYFPKGTVCGWGDHGYAFGLWQIDRRYHGGFVWSEQARSVEGQCGYACRLLHEAREFFRHSHSWGSGGDLERAVIASYNAGPGNVLHAVVLGASADSVTTGKDYSTDVLGRMARLRETDARFFDVTPDTPDVA